MKGKTARLLSGLLIAGAAVILPWKGYSEEKPIFSQEYNLQLTGQYGNTRNEKAVIGAYLHKDKNSVVFFIASENFERKNWTKKEQAMPLQFRYALMDPPDIYVLHPKSVRISEIEQSAQVVASNLNKRVMLRPFKGSKEELIQNLARRGVKELLSESVPFLGNLIDKGMDYIAKTRRENLEETVRKVKEDYVFTEIPNYVADIASIYNETARIYLISFNMQNAEGNVPMSLFFRPHFKHLSKNQRGLEDLVINFSLEGKGDQKQKICSEMQKEYQTKGGCNFKEIDLNNDGKNELQVTIPDGNRFFYFSVFQMSKNGYVKILKGHTSDLGILEKKGREKYHDIFTGGIYNDGSVPECVPLSDWPVMKEIYGWNGKEYTKREVVKEKYSRAKTHKDCGGKNNPVPIPEKHKKEFQICAYSADRVATIFYKREGALINGELRYETDWQEYSRSSNSCDKNQIAFKDSNSFVEIRILRVHPRYECYTDPGRITLNSEKRMELFGCSSR